MKGRPRIPDYSLVDHTADLGITLRGPDLATLFEDAALAMLDVIADLGRVEPREERRIEVTGLDREDLLVAWLGEILSLHDAEDLLFCRFRVEEISETGASGA